VTLAAAVAAGAAGADEMPGLSPVDLNRYEPRRAASPLSLIEPLVRNHPESLEGRPSLRIDMRKDGERFVAEIETGGLLDDAIEARQFRALIGRRDGQWELQALGQRWRCSRGPLGMTGAWTTMRCS
jgi:hypothetical protein